MDILKFPDPEMANEDGLLALGGNLEPSTLRLAYQSGIFPWPIPNLPLPWFSPDPRAILELKDFHVSRSFRKLLKQEKFKCTLDQNFREVIESCAHIPRKRSHGKSWITKDMIEAYTELHTLGDTHSVEVWLEGNCVGGIYGVDCGGVFAAESMFHKVDNASKVALHFLVTHLKENGSDWMDLQVLNPHTRSFGGKEVRRSDFLKRLKATQRKKKRLFG